MEQSAGHWRTRPPAAAALVAMLALAGCGAGDAPRGSEQPPTAAAPVAAMADPALQLLNPAEELQELDPAGVLRWSDVPGADVYELWAFEDAALRRPAESSGGLRSRDFRFSRLAAGRVYHLKLYARVAGAWRESPPVAVRTATRIWKPRLLNPQEELEGLHEAGLLRWNEVPGADRYELWVYRDATLLTAAENSGAIRETQYQLTGLAAGRSYFVKLFARVDGVWHGGDALRVAVVADAARARILNPQEELDAFGTRALLRWSAVTGATAYEVWIYGDPGLVGVVESSGRLTTRSYAVRTLQPGRSYFAQVHALVGGEWRVGSPMMLATTGGSLRPRLTNAQEELEAFPAAGALTWSEVAGAEFYEVWLYTNAGLVSLAESGRATGSSYQLRQACADATYYVQVHARVNGQWTAGWPMRLDVRAGPSSPDCVPPAPTVQFAADPADIVYGDTVTLSWSTKFATSCVAGGDWSGTKSLQGQEPLGRLTRPGSYTLSCTGASGTTIARALVLLEQVESSVAGHIALAPVTQVDGDVNDTAAPYRANDSLATAQSLPNPVVLGGYVNEAFRGSDGRSYRAGDYDDLYRVSLSEGQVVELVMPSAVPGLPDSLRDDADLELYDRDGLLVDVSDGVDQVERLVVRTAGPHYLRVTVWSGAPLYRLSVGTQPLAGGAPAPRLSHEFVPGEVILRLRPGVDASGAASAAQKPSRALAARHGLRGKAGDASRELLLTIPKEALQSAASRKASRPGGEATGLRVPEELRERLATLEYVKRLRSEREVASADLNRILRASATPSDPGYAVQRWHYELIALPAAWNVTLGSRDVTAAVVDTGVFRHSDLRANLVAGYDFVSDPRNPDGDGLDPDADDPGCSVEGNATFHGTHVAGTVAASVNNGFGVAGVAGNVQLMPVRVLNSCSGGTLYDVLQGVRFAAGLANDSGTLPARRADVLNLSLGGAGACPASLAGVFREVRSQGVTVVAAAGNDNSAEPSIPASCDGVVAVASVGPTRARASYSNFGASWVDVAAPGGEARMDANGDGRADGVYSTHASGSGASRFDSYALLQGTSMAAPHVTGVVALMKSVRPSLTPAEFDSMLTGGQLTDDIGPEGPDALGIGLVNAYKAVLAASAQQPQLPPTLAVAPAALEFGDVGASAEVVVSNAGTGALEVTGTSVSAPWIRVAPVATGGGGLGRYSVSVARDGLAEGHYSGWVEFVSSAGSRRVTVLMQVRLAGVVPDAGWGYVLLIDAVTGESVADMQGPARGEALPYLLGPVPSGNYFVIAGTDLDNDQYICDEGEACGVYPVEARPVAVRARGAVSGVDFSAGFRGDVGAAATSTGGIPGPLPVVGVRRPPSP